MRGEPEHDEVRVQSVQDVVLVRVVARLGALPAHEVHDLVLPLAGLAGVRQNDLVRVRRGEGGGGGERGALRTRDTATISASRRRRGGRRRRRRKCV